MSLEKLLDISSNRELKQGMSEERLRAQIGPLRKLIAFYREYPDYFIDYLVWGTHKPTQEMRDRHPSNFHFFFYQRIKNSPYVQ